MSLRLASQQAPDQRPAEPALASVITAINRMLTDSQLLASGVVIRCGCAIDRPMPKSAPKVGSSHVGGISNRFGSATCSAVAARTAPRTGQVDSPSVKPPPCRDDDRGRDQLGGEGQHALEIVTHSTRLSRTIFGISHRQSLAWSPIERTVCVDLDLDEMMPGRSVARPRPSSTPGGCRRRSRHAPSPTASQSAMLVTKMRDRTTWSNVAPALASASPMIRRITLVCSPASPCPTTCPSTVAVVAGNMHVVAAAHHPAVADNGLPRPARTPSLDRCAHARALHTAADPDQRSTSCDWTPIER